MLAAFYHNLKVKVENLVFKKSTLIGRANDQSNPKIYKTQIFDRSNDILEFIKQSKSTKHIVDFELETLEEFAALDLNDEKIQNDDAESL